MKILVDDINSTIVNARELSSAVTLVRGVCRAQPKNYKFMPKFKAGTWDGFISLMAGWSSFPTGLLTQVVEELEKNSYTVDLSYIGEDDESTYNISEDMLTGVTLRQYQIDAIRTMLFRKRGIVRMATNSGKTEIMAAFLKAVDKKSVILVHRKELMYQTAKRLIERGVQDVGYLGDGECIMGKHMVCMIQTLGNYIDVMDFSGTRIVFADECHTTANTDRSFDILGKLPGLYRFGLSGTPLKFDDLADLKLKAYTGEIIFELTNEYLISGGYSAKPIVDVKRLTADKMWYKEPYQYAYDDLIVKNEQRNNFIIDYVNKGTGLRLVIVNRIAHGETLHAALPGSIMLTGGDTSTVRNTEIDRMRENKEGIYIVTPIWDEGVDIPAIDCVILAAGGKSHVKLLQRIGRGLRKKEGENILRVLDFFDDTNIFLKKHSDERMSTYKKEGFQINVL